MAIDSDQIILPVGIPGGTMAKADTGQGILRRGDSFHFIDIADYILWVSAFRAQPAGELERTVAAAGVDRIGERLEKLEHDKLVSRISGDSRDLAVAQQIRIHLIARGAGIEGNDVELLVAERSTNVHIGMTAYLVLLASNGPKNLLGVCQEAIPDGEDAAHLAVNIVGALPDLLRAGAIQLDGHDEG